MTTLIIDTKKTAVYTDGRMTSNDSILGEKTQKCWSVAWCSPTALRKQRCMITGAGDWGLIGILREWLRTGDENFLLWCAAHNFNILPEATAGVYVLTEAGEVWLFMPPFYRPELHVPESRYICDGSGYMAAQAALLALGDAHATQALKIAKKLDMGSGGCLSRYSLAKDGSLKQEIIEDC